MLKLLPFQWFWDTSIAISQVLEHLLPKMLYLVSFPYWNRCLFNCFQPLALLIHIPEHWKNALFSKRFVLKYVHFQWFGRSKVYISQALEHLLPKMLYVVSFWYWNLCLFSGFETLALLFHRFWSICFQKCLI